MRIAGRLLAITVGFVLLVLGGVAVAKAYWPEAEAARVAGRLVARAGGNLLELLGQAENPRAAMNAALSSLVMRFGAVPVGLILFVAALLPRQRKYAQARISCGNS